MPKEVLTELRSVFSEMGISENTLMKITTIVENAVEEKTSYLVEKAEDYAKYVKSQLEQDNDSINEQLNEKYITLREQIEAYEEYVRGEFEALEEKAEAYSQYAIGEKDKIMEKADEYTEYALNEQKKLVAMADQYAEYVKNETIEELSEYLDKYAKLVVEEFIEEKDEQLVEHAEYMRAKSAFDSIINTLQENAIVFSEETIDEGIKRELAEQREKYDALFNKFVNLKEQTRDTERREIFNEMTNDLADSSKERIEELMEGMTFSSNDAYKNTIGRLIRQLSRKKTTDTVNEDVRTGADSEIGGRAFNTLSEMNTFGVRDIINPTENSDIRSRMASYIANL